MKRWCCSTHAGSEVSHHVGGIFANALSAFWCSDSCVSVGLWASSGLLVAGVHLIEKGGP